MGLAVVLIGMVLFGGHYWGYGADQDAAFRFTVRWLMILVFSEVLGGWLVRRLPPRKHS